MFDIGFSELLLIAVVALVVLGPERLPKVARTVGHLFGRAQRYVSDIKADINREMAMDELRKTQAKMQAAVNEVQYVMTDEVKKTETTLHEAVNSIDPRPVEAPPQEDSPAADDRSPQLELGLDEQQSGNVPGQKA